ncbi:uncharacterized protein CCOS01_04945 [Colletotrichum costaricense]|uniref:CBM1 domain-containing protein n=1 Tax=Colletotrichum costaricense TaxID=1209916 RepID=A0AAI9Z502_9PEZI|nr:uncharacterized protein CCOS01_04945 [Colletotrichum costaricense]KAI3536423.1 hypothetical protein CSPX01_10872 [Colletotrichum filicis]KAK1532962.1 hypothetical protein CCOS01_04945 [Colletotrichum costaricense]
MKYLTAVIVALATSSNAAVCNYGWGKPAGSTCPGVYPNTYCRVKTSKHLATFQFPELVRILATDVQFYNRALVEEVSSNV